MAEKKTQPADETSPVGATDPPTNYQDQVSNQETTIRDASVPDEKPDASTVAQVEEVKD